MCQSQERCQKIHVLSFSQLIMQTLLRYCVGLDRTGGPDQQRYSSGLSVIDQTGRVTVKATTKQPNKPTSFPVLMSWVARHRKQNLPLTYLMESTGVYHQAVAWYLHQQDQSVIILLPNKAKYYLKSLGYKSKNDKIDAQGLSRMGLEQQLPVWNRIAEATTF